MRRFKSKRTEKGKNDYANSGQNKVEVATLHLDRADFGQREQPGMRRGQGLRAALAGAAALDRLVPIRQHQVTQHRR